MGQAADVSPPSRWKENTFLGWHHWRRALLQLLGSLNSSSQLPRGAWLPVIPVVPRQQGGATGAGAASTHCSGADWDGCGVHPGAPCPCPGLAVPGSATQRGQGDGHLPGHAVGCSTLTAAPPCALPRHTRPRHGHRVPRAGQRSLIPISPCRTCSVPRMPPSMTCNSSWPESAR